LDAAQAPAGLSQDSTTSVPPVRAPERRPAALLAGQGLLVPPALQGARLLLERSWETPLAW